MAITLLEIFKEKYGSRCMTGDCISRAMKLIALDYAMTSGDIDSTMAAVPEAVRLVEGRSIV